ncbi:SDR family oxidoreductase, partial [Streptomyces sp. NPDC060020]|uniref:SDR family oxidoreductase n=1 Tax=Streptomyces sp. NPDC060020 TaxID=3347038 RepID=UPI00369B5330
MTTCESAARILVAGATGEVGRLAATELIGRGAHLAPAGRNERRLAELAASSGCPTRRLDAYDLDACAGAGPWARAKLGGLDGVLVTIGVAGFGPAVQVPNAAAEHLMTVNALCPMAVLRGAVPAVRDGGFLAAGGGGGGPPPPPPPGAPPPPPPPQGSGGGGPGGEGRRGGRG